MKILLACEYSNTVSKEFRKKGHTVISCDLLSNDEDNTNHYQGDVFDIIDDGFDMMIAHPPCTYLTLAANKYYDINKYGEKAIQRIKDREQAIEFFLRLWNAPIEKICIENPVGVMCNYIDRENYQIIQPYHFGDAERKTTQLWLKNLTPLQYGQNLFYQSDIVKPEIIQYSSGRTSSKWLHDTFRLPSKDRWKIRSKTFPGIARAMAEQWG